MTEQELDYRREALRDFPRFPLLYCILKEQAERRGLADCPRDPMEFVTSSHWRKKYHTHFRMNLIDTWALVIWDAFGIRGGFTNYTPDHPFVVLALDFACGQQSPQEEIAQMLGYANHSGVNKRIQHIRKEMRKYMEESNG